MSWSAQRELGGRFWMRVMLWITLTLGWLPGRALLYPITGYYVIHSRAARAASRDYLGRVLGRPATIRDVLRHIFTFASVILERAFLLSGRLDRFAIDVEGLVALLEQGRGCMLFGAHFGSFEALRVVGRHSPVRVRPLMFRQNAGAATRVLEALDPALQEAIIEIGRPDTMLQVQESLARGEIVGLLADRTPDGAKGIEGKRIMVPFLGSAAVFPAGPFILAAALGAPVMLFYGIRTGKRRYTVRFIPFAERIVLPRTTRAQALHLWIGRYAAALEAVCRAHPFNWFNFFPFWEAAEGASRLGGGVSNSGGLAGRGPGSAGP